VLWPLSRLSSLQTGELRHRHAFAFPIEEGHPFQRVIVQKHEFAADPAENVDLHDLVPSRDFFLSGEKTVFRALTRSAAMGVNGTSTGLG
jgi:hypothetical protein